jgi:hypothetical protein
MARTSIRFTANRFDCLSELEAKMGKETGHEGSKIITSAITVEIMRDVYYTKMEIAPVGFTVHLEPCAWLSLFLSTIWPSACASGKIVANQFRLATLGPVIPLVCKTSGSVCRPWRR